MTPDWMGLLIGMCFGGALYLGGLAEPDKIIGTLRWKDFHAFKTIAVFVLVGMAGTWMLDMGNASHFSVKPAAMAAVLIGGALLGIGFGMTGYCPGTGLACAAAGRIDAIVSVLGMFVGAMVFIWIYPSIVQPIDAIANYGKKMLPEITGVSRTVWTLGIVIIGIIALKAASLKKSV